MVQVINRITGSEPVRGHHWSATRQKRTASPAASDRPILYLESQITTIWIAGRLSLAAPPSLRTKASEDESSNAVPITLPATLRNNRTCRTETMPSGSRTISQQVFVLTAIDDRLAAVSMVNAFLFAFAAVPTSVRQKAVDVLSGTTDGQWYCQVSCQYELDKSWHSIRS